jgi:hypothetical protein
MVNTLTATIKSAIGINYQGHDISLGTQKGNLPFHPDKIIGSGTGAEQSDLAYFDTRSIVASGDDNIDLNSDLKSPIGEKLNFARITAIMIKAKSTNGDDIIYSPGPSMGFVGPFPDATSSIKISPGETFLVTSTNLGWIVVPASGHFIKIANSNSTGAASYDLVIIGRSI